MIRALIIFAVLGSSLGRADTAFLDDLEKRSLRYFLDEAHPVTGLVRDRAPLAPASWGHYRMASLAATGFGLAALANAAKRGLLDKGVVHARVERTLRFVRDKLYHRGGWLYHFVDEETGVRWGHCEVSSVDTAWFLAGALYAGAVFPGTSIETLAAELFDRVDFSDMMTDGGKTPTKRTLSMGWLPESGYLPWQWDSYAEHLLMVVLGLGHGTAPLPTETWSAWKRPGSPLIGPDLPLFAHQYSHLFIDFRGKNDGIADYWLSTVDATKRDRAVCAGDARFRTYREGFWGLSASGSTSGYQAFSPVFHDGTVCPGCAGASLPFLAGPVTDSLRAWATGPYSAKIWGRYGFADSLNLDQGWYDPDVIGITVGAIYLAVAATRPDGALWVDFERIPAIQRGLKRAKLVP